MSELREKLQKFQDEAAREMPSQQILKLTMVDLLFAMEDRVHDGSCAIRDEAKKYILETPIARCAVCETYMPQLIISNILGEKIWLDEHSSRINYNFNYSKNLGDIFKGFNPLVVYHVLQEKISNIQIDKSQGDEQFKKALEDIEEFNGDFDPDFRIKECGGYKEGLIADFIRALGDTPNCTSDNDVLFRWFPSVFGTHLIPKDFGERKRTAEMLLEKFPEINDSYYSYMLARVLNQDITHWATNASTAALESLSDIYNKYISKVTDISRQSHKEPKYDNGVLAALRFINPILTQRHYNEATQANDAKAKPDNIIKIEDYLYIRDNNGKYLKAIECYDNDWNQEDLDAWDKLATNGKDTIVATKNGIYSSNAKNEPFVCMDNEADCSYWVLNESAYCKCIAENSNGFYHRGGNKGYKLMIKNPITKQFEEFPYDGRPERSYGPNFVTSISKDENGKYNRSVYRRDMKTGKFIEDAKFPYTDYGDCIFASFDGKNISLQYMNMSGGDKEGETYSYTAEIGKKGKFVTKTAEERKAEIEENRKTHRIRQRVWDEVKEAPVEPQPRKFRPRKGASLINNKGGNDGK